VEVINQVLTLFFLMAAGFACAKLKVAGPVMAEKFSTFIMNVSLPAMLLSSFQRPFSNELLGEAGAALAVSAGVYGFSFLAAFFYPRILGMKGPERGVHRYAVIFSNCGFIGYPMVQSLLGPDYLFHAVLFNIPFSFLAYSVGAWLISKEGDEALSLSWKTFANPSVIATLLGFMLFIFSVSIPGPLFQSVKMIGDITSPLSMIVIGITLAQANIKQVFGRWRIYVTVAVRLVVLPLLVLAAASALGISRPVLMLAVLIIAMPAASTTSIMASLYRVCPEEGSSLVFLSTTLCMFTIPLVLLLAGVWTGVPL
jgi:predicted permease